MSKKKLITVNGDSEKWYDKVIFVVKNDKKIVEKNMDFVAEAEKIISDYMLQSNIAYKNSSVSTIVRTKKKSKIDGIDIFLMVSIFICLSMMVMLFIGVSW